MSNICLPKNLITDSSVSHEMVMALMVIKLYYAGRVPEKFYLNPDQMLMTVFEFKDDVVPDEIYYSFLKGLSGLEKKKYLRKIHSKNEESSILKYQWLREETVNRMKFNVEFTKEEVLRIYAYDGTDYDPSFLFRLFVYVLAKRESKKDFPKEVRERFFLNGFVNLGHFFFRDRYATIRERSSAARQAVKVLFELKVLKRYTPAKREIRWKYGRVTEFIYKPEDEIYLAAMLTFVTELKESRDRKTKLEYNPEHEVLFVTDSGKMFVGYDTGEEED